MLSLLNDPRWAAYIERVFDELVRRYEGRWHITPATLDGAFEGAHCKGAIEGLNKLKATLAATRRRCERIVEHATSGPAQPDTRGE